jgi:hypothetical protein
MEKPTRPQPIFTRPTPHAEIVRAIAAGTTLLPHLEDRPYDHRAVVLMVDALQTALKLIEKAN